MQRVAEPVRHDVPYHGIVGVSRKFLGVVCGLLLVCALVLYGIALEKIMTIPYGPTNKQFFQFFKVRAEDEGHPDSHFFRDSPFLVFWTRAVGSVSALIMAKINREVLKNKAPVWKYLLIAIAASIASILQYESLKYLSFTVQILAKCCKALPVLLYGRCINFKRYVLVDWLGAWMITGGSLLFVFGGEVDSNYSRSRSWVSGIFMLFLFVICDGFVSWCQVQIYNKYEASKYNQMFWINTTSAVFCFFVSLIPGRLTGAIRLGCQYPVLFEDMTFMGVMAVLGQWFSHTLMQEFDASVFLAFLNVRMTLSFIFSDWMYAHKNTAAQIVALSIIGFALVFRSLVSFTSWWAEESEQESDEKEPLMDQQGEEGNARAEEIRKPNLRKNWAGCCLPTSVWV